MNWPGAFVDTQRPVIGGTAEPGSTVTVMLDGRLEGTPEADDTGTWRFTPGQALEAGPHVVVASATDRAGNPSPGSDTYSFTIKRSHYGWSCASAPALPAIWIFLTLAFALARRRRRSPFGSAPT